MEVQSRPSYLPSLMMRKSRNIVLKDGVLRTKKSSRLHNHSNIDLLPNITQNKPMIKPKHYSDAYEVIYNKVHQNDIQKQRTRFDINEIDIRELTNRYNDMKDRSNYKKQINPSRSTNISSKRNVTHNYTSLNQNSYFSSPNQDYSYRRNIPFSQNSSMISRQITHHIRLNINTNEYDKCTSASLNLKRVPSQSTNVVISDDAINNNTINDGYEYEDNFMDNENQHYLHSLSSRQYSGIQSFPTTDFRIKTIKKRKEIIEKISRDYFTEKSLKHDKLVAIRENKSIMIGISKNWLYIHQNIRFCDILMNMILISVPIKRRNDKKIMSSIVIQTYYRRYKAIKYRNLLKISLNIIKKTIKKFIDYRKKNEKNYLPRVIYHFLKTYSKQNCFIVKCREYIIKIKILQKFCRKIYAIKNSRLLYLDTLFDRLYESITEKCNQNPLVNLLPCTYPNNESLKFLLRKSTSLTQLSKVSERTKIELITCFYYKIIDLNIINCKMQLRNKMNLVESRHVLSLDDMIDFYKDDGLSFTNRILANSNFHMRRKSFITTIYEQNFHIMFEQFTNPPECRSRSRTRTRTRSIAY